MEEVLEKANELLKVQGTDGNWNHDNYMTGMYNGMELIVSLFEERNPVYRDSPEVDKQAIRDSLVNDYKRRFTDIKLITFSEKKGTATVILQDGVVGTVVPCPNEVLDERVGMLEAYIKAKQNQRIIRVFREKHNLFDSDVKVKGNIIKLHHGYSYASSYKCNTELSLLENLNNSWSLYKAKEKEQKISRAIEKLVRE